MKTSLRFVSIVASALLMLGLVSVPVYAGKPAKPAPSPSADISISITDSPDPALLAQEVTYVITVRSAGPSTASVWVNASIEGTMRPTATSSQGSCSTGSNFSCSLGSMPRGATATVTVTTRPTRLGSVTLQASATGNVEDPNLSNNATSESTTVMAAPIGGGCGNIVGSGGATCAFTSTGAPITATGAFLSIPFQPVCSPAYCPLIRWGGFWSLHLTVSDSNGNVLATCTGAVSCTTAPAQPVTAGTLLRCVAWASPYDYGVGALAGAFGCTG